MQQRGIDVRCFAVEKQAWLIIFDISQRIYQGHLYFFIIPKNVAHSACRFQAGYTIQVKTIMYIIIDVDDIVPGLPFTQQQVVTKYQ